MCLGLKLREILFLLPVECYDKGMSHLTGIVLESPLSSKKYTESPKPKQEKIMRVLAALEVLMLAITAKTEIFQLWAMLTKTSTPTAYLLK